MSRLRAVLFAFVTAVAAPAAATTVVPMTPAEIASSSDAVARVVVRGHEARWVGRRILTFYTVDVVDLWAERPGTQALARRVIVALPGGVVGGVGQRVPGVPELVDGQSYVLCLGAATGPEGARGVVGLWQGVWRLDERGVVQGYTHDGEVPAGSLDALKATLVAR
jgi:hypothetical protein